MKLEWFRLGIKGAVPLSSTAMMPLEAGIRGPAVCHQTGCTEISEKDQLQPRGLGYAVTDERTGLVRECCEKGNGVPMQLETGKGGEADPEHLQRAEKNCC